jgi:hypothetical protein
MAEKSKRKKKSNWNKQRLNEDNPLYMEDRSVWIRSNENNKVRNQLKNIQRALPFEFFKVDKIIQEEIKTEILIINLINSITMFVINDVDKLDC